MVHIKIVLFTKCADNIRKTAVFQKFCKYSVFIDHFLFKIGKIVL